MRTIARINTQELSDAFRKARNQTQVEMTNFQPKGTEKPQQQNKPFERGNNKKLSHNTSSDRFTSFLNKYEDLEQYIDTFSTQELMYFFREKARENGYKYVIANMKRDMGIFKRLQQNYEPREICLMVEFLFTSDQDYLDPTTLQPTVLSSSWCNKIYSDSLLWVDDKYVPTIKKKHSTREWQGDTSKNNAKIGDWD